MMGIAKVPVGRLAAAAIGLSSIAFGQANQAFARLHAGGRCALQMP